MPYSICCGAETKNTEQDICPICRYYCDWEEIPSEEPSDEDGIKIILSLKNK